LVAGIAIVGPQDILAFVVDPGRKLPSNGLICVIPTGGGGVRVTTISLNRGATRHAVQQAEPGWRPMRDFAVGIIESAADGRA